MATLNWKSLLSSYGIPFVETGSNVARGHINIKCPWCRDADPSEHLGINLTLGYWGCWRNQLHRGSNPHRLLAKLLHLSYNQVNALLKQQNVDLPSWDSIFDAVAALDFLKTDTALDYPPKELEFDPEFKEIVNTGIRKKFFDYLVDRGFSAKSVDKLIKRYNLKCCLVGKFANRIIIPVYFQGKLVSWSGRSIYPEAQVRYRNLPSSRNALNLSSLVYNYDYASLGGKVLILTEGQFDVMKVDSCGNELGIHCIGLMGLTASTERLYLIEDLVKFYDRVIVCFDRGEELTAITSSIFFILPPSSIITDPPFRHKDFGEMKEQELQNWLKSLV